MLVELTAEESLREGEVITALARLQDQVRVSPDDPKLRIFLFQLLCVAGQWQRALAQLSVAVSLDPDTVPMAQTYSDAVRCEMIRDDVFDGRTSPMVFGEPEPWMALLAESLLLANRGEQAAAERLRHGAFEEAPPSTGIVDGRPFQWIADADSRLGPVLEAVINGRYYWVPFTRLSRILIEKPTDLRDIVWVPAHLEFENGGMSAALLPARYPGSEAALDNAVVMGRKTIWTEAGPEAYHGLGQRMLVTDADELPLLQTRSIALDPPNRVSADPISHA